MADNLNDNIFGEQGIQGVQGAQGIQGIQGMRGAQGVQGIQGEDGFQGIQGVQGKIGSKGANGPQGIQGIEGQRGSTGIQGAKGKPGQQGPKGEKGMDGIQGERGEKGTTGAQGARGEKGAKGAQGSAGFGGETGAQGAKGAQGARGCDGAQGDAGSRGLQGPQGLRGEAGAQGVRGCVGEPGVKGSKGVQGPQGARGEIGAQGGRGPQGEAGAQGPRGPKGAQGARGVMGYQGNDGEIGIQGLIGENGAIWLDGIRLNGYNTHLFSYNTEEGKFKPVHSKDYLRIDDGAKITLWLNRAAYDAISESNRIVVDKVVNGEYVPTEYEAFYVEGDYIAEKINPDVDLNGVIEFVFNDGAWYYSGGLLSGNGIVEDSKVVTIVEVVDGNYYEDTDCEWNPSTGEYVPNPGAEPVTSVDKPGKYLKLVFTGTADPVYIDGSEFIQEYGEGDGIDIENNVISVSNGDDLEFNDAGKLTVKDSVISYDSENDTLVLSVAGKMNANALKVIEDYIDDFDCGEY